jgi:hypothetical protein
VKAHSTTWRRALTLLLLAMAASLLGGCPPRDDETPDGGPGTNGDNGLAQWLFWPRSMRIHPATMIREDRETGKPMIEARLEFRDQLDHLTKAMGEVRFELHDHDPGERPDEPIRVWNADVRALEPNRLHWDHVTETYLFRLGLDEVEDQPEPWYLRAMVLSSDGRRFSAAMRVK